MKYKRVLLALLHSLFVLILCYLYGNSPYTFGSDTSVTQWYDRWKCMRRTKSEDVPDSLLFVNVAYDRQLVDVYDNDGFRMGNMDITDRKSLLTFLKAAKEADNYKYILLDVLFSKEYATDVDEELFRTIASMRNIVIPKSSLNELADSILLGKARYGDYETTLEVNNFVKYSLVKDGEYTLPFSVFNELTGAEIKSFGPIYYTHGHLCRRCISPIFNMYLRNDTTSKGYSSYYNLGEDLLNDNVDIAEYTRDRFIIIGDLKERDMHDTYIGPMAGSLINYDTIETLSSKGYVIYWTSIVILWLLYAVVVLFLYKSISLWEHPRIARYFSGRLAKLVMSFVGLSFLFGGLGILCYILFDMEFDVLIPSLYFSIFSQIISIKNQWKGNI